MCSAQIEQTPDSKQIVNALKNSRTGKMIGIIGSVLKRIPKKMEIKIGEEGYFAQLNSKLIGDAGFRKKYTETEAVFRRMIPGARKKLGEKYWKMFCAGATRLIEEHKGIDAKKIAKWVANNSDQINLIKERILELKGSKKYGRVCPGRNRKNDEIVHFTAISSVIIGNLYRIDPKILITLTGYETQFRNIDSHAGAKGICQIIPGTSSVRSLKDKYWKKKANRVIAGAGGTPIEESKTEALEMYNPLLCMMESGRTLMTKIAAENSRRRRKKENVISPKTLQHPDWKSTKRVLWLYNGSEIYADKLHPYILKFYELKNIEFEYKKPVAVARK